MRKIFTAIALATPLLASASGNLVTNGSFEDPGIAAGSWTVLSGGALTGWTAAGSGAEVRNAVAGNAQDADQYVELDSYANSSISQSFATVAGAWYTLSFWVSNRSGVAVDSNGIDWSFGSSSGSAPVLLFNNTGDNVWNLVTVNVQATGSTTTLSFYATGTDDSFGSSLDNVSVTTAVPEPGSAAMLLAGLGALALTSRRRRQA